MKVHKLIPSKEKDEVITPSTYPKTIKTPTKEIIKLVLPKPSEIISHISSI